MLYHPSPLVERLPIQGRVPMTTYEWYRTPLECRSSGLANPFLLMVENTGTTIVPVILTAASNIKVRDQSHA